MPSRRIRHPDILHSLLILLKREWKRGDDWIHVAREEKAVRPEKGGGNIRRVVQCLEDLFICTEWSASLAASSVSILSYVISWSAWTSLSLGVVGLEAQLLSVYIIALVPPSLLALDRLAIEHIDQRSSFWHSYGLRGSFSSPWLTSSCQ